ncbi:hypothetical protein [Zavarzinia compransoris]|uniref:hypothetical protein n=1 Tax=Zavarzinia compransoris TaxID=1264899 RepID=UPI0010EB24F8|nr:hypothetical protein [Zavarzinia compransoris]TDP47205.1 hypothetical protein DES42_103377 [Zavarzinia compransoris]
MPIETRTIAFTGAEVAAALVDFHLRRRFPLPQGRIARITFSEPPDIRGLLSIETRHDDRPQAVTLDSEVLAAALLFYCLSRRVPLPAASQKQLRLAGDGLELVITTVLG